MRRGLVLAGGGAKGAYAFGCLQAFRKHPIHFEYVGGTSVGALNAVIWSSGQFEYGEQIWNQLSFDSTYPVVIPTAKWWPRWCVWMFCRIHVAVRLLWSVLQGESIDPERLMHVRAAIAIKFLASALVLGVSCFVGYRLISAGAIFRRSWWLWLIWILLTGGALSEVWRFTTSLANGDKNGLGRFYSLLFDVIIWVSILVVFWRHGITFANSGIFLCLCVAWLIGYSAKALMTWVAAMLLDGRISVLSQTPLAAKLNCILSNRLEVPVFVTVATKVDLFDASAPWKTTSHLKPDWAETGGHHAPVQSCWLPYYVWLNDLRDPRLRLDFCLASAALPFGIVPPIRIDGRAYVDGGLADNCPAHPLLDKQLDEIFVVLLEPVEDYVKKELQIGVNVDSWTNRNRLALLAHLGVPATRDSGHRFASALTAIQYRGKLPRVRFFHPDASLGDFTRGTLRFEAKFARDLIVKGEEDTKRRLLEKDLK